MLNEEMQKDNWGMITEKFDDRKMSQEVIDSIINEVVEGKPVPPHVKLSSINRVLGWMGLALVVAIRPDYSAGTAFWIERKC